MKHVDFDTYAIMLAYTATTRSKDPKTRAGCCILDGDDHSIISIGYNGTPRNIPDDQINWNIKEEKLPYMLHAEQNAINNCVDRKRLKNSHLYLYIDDGQPPCNACTTQIIQAQISRIVLAFYLPHDKNRYTLESNEKNPWLRMIDMAGIRLEIFPNFIECIERKISQENKNLERLKTYEDLISNRLITQGSSKCLS